MKMPLVSIITPCYNGEKYLSHFLDSIINQTYPNIEFVFINDGSIDGTEDVFNSYIDLFKQKSIKYNYIYQENKGQAAAINKGLAIFKGKYFIWPDSDDELHCDHVKKKVAYLERNKDFGIVFSRTNMIEKSTNKIIKTIDYDFTNNNLFVDLMTDKSILCVPGGFMIRSASFFSVYPDRHIYENRQGQNFQILLPVIHDFKCGYVDQVLYNYFIHQTNHSNSAKTLADQYTRLANTLDIIDKTLDRINADKDKYLSLAKEYYTKHKLQLAYNYKDKAEIQKQYDIIKESYTLDRNDKLLYRRGKSRMFDILYKALISPKKVIKKIMRKLTHD